MPTWLLVIMGVFLTVPATLIVVTVVSIIRLLINWRTTIALQNGERTTGRVVWLVVLAVLALVLASIALFIVS